MGIEFEGEREVEMTDELAARMLDGLNSGVSFVGKLIEFWSFTPGKLTFRMQGGVTVEISGDFTSKVTSPFQRAAQRENRRQAQLEAADREPDPVRTEGQRIIDNQRSSEGE
jgi:hypothetical protein